MRCTNLTGSLLIALCPSLLLAAAPSSPFPTDPAIANKIFSTCSQAKDPETCMKKQGVNLFERKKKTLVVYPLNGKPVVFKDEGDDEGNGEYYSYIRYLPSHHFHLIEVSNPGGVENVIVSDNGKKLYTNNLHISPDQTLAYGMNIEADPAVKIYDLSTLNVLWQSPLHSKMPTYTDTARWQKDGSLLITWMCKGERTEKTHFVKRDDKWVMNGKICPSNG